MREQHDSVGRDQETERETSRPSGEIDDVDIKRKKEHTLCESSTCSVRLERDREMQTCFMRELHEIGEVRSCMREPVEVERSRETEIER